MLSFLLVHPSVEIKHRGVCIVANMMGASKKVAEKIIETDIMEVLMLLSKYGKLIQY